MQHRRGRSPKRSTEATNGQQQGTNAASSSVGQLVGVATVRRRKFGTSPFDQNWLNVDCCGLVCAAMTYGLHLYGCYAVCCILIPPWMSVKDADGNRQLTGMGMLHCFAFCSVALMAMIAHLKAMMTDPGAVPPDALPLPSPETMGTAHAEQPPPPDKVSAGNGDSGLPKADGTSGVTTTMSAASAAMVVGGAAVAAAAGAVGAAMPSKPPPTPRRGQRMCRRCNSYKPPRAHHCSVCNRCIVKMDHHCPWVNNCVGIGNHKYFLLFIFYTSVSCIYSLSLLVYRFIDCVGKLENRNARCLDDKVHLLNLIGLVVEAVLFGIFTVCMMCDQWDVVMSNVTHIDRLKGQSYSADSRRSGINEVFGTGNGKNKGRESRFRTDWLSPFGKVCFPSSIEDEIMGFCRPLRRSSTNDVEIGNGNGDRS